MPASEDRGGPEGDGDSEMSISQLRFTIQTLQSQLALANHEKSSSSATLTRLVAEKSAQCDRLKASFDSLYAEKQADHSKYTNELQVARAKYESSIAKLDAANLENSRLESDNAILHRKVLEYSKETREAREKLALYLEEELLCAAEAENLKLVNKALAQENSHLNARLEEYAQQLSASSQQTSFDHFQSKIQSLTSANSELKAQVDRLQQHNLSVGVLSEKNDQLSSQLARSQQALQQARQNEVDLLEAVASNKEINVALESIVPDSITSTNKVATYLSAINEVKCQNAVLVAECKTLKQVEQELSAKLEHWRDEVAPQHEAERAQLQKTLADKNVAIAAIERQVALDSQEIAFLRKSLDGDTNPQNINDKFAQQLVTLESLVSEYRSEITKLKLKASTNFEMLPKKRAKYDDTRMISERDASELINLRTTVKNLHSQLHAANQQLASLQQVAQKKSELKVFQLANNPAALDQRVKRATLDALRKENEDLIARFVSSDTADEDGQLVPRLVFVRQEDDKARLQAQVDSATRRITRLKSAYTEKSKDILTIISRYFGYALEFLPNPVNPDVMSSRLKLVSRYMPESTQCYLTIDLTTTAMKVYGDYDFKSMFEQLLSSFTKDQVPCFLSALNLKVYDLYCKHDTET